MSALSMEQLCQLTADDSGRIPQSLVMAIIMEESGGQPDVVSKAGAVGLMQIMQKFHPKIKLTDPATNIRVGCTILQSDYRYLNHFRLGLSPTEPIDWSLYANVGRTLRGYNMGCGTVVWYDQHPEHAYPPEVDRYVEIILQLFRKGFCK